MTHLDLASYLLGAASSFAALGLYIAVRRGRQTAARRREARRRRADAIARAERHDVYKARVRFTPSDQIEG